MCILVHTYRTISVLYNILAERFYVFNSYRTGCQQNLQYSGNTLLTRGNGFVIVYILGRTGDSCMLSAKTDTDQFRFVCLQFCVLRFYKREMRKLECTESRPNYDTLSLWPVPSSCRKQYDHSYTVAECKRLPHCLLN